MSSLTIHDLDEALERRLRMRAAQRNRSMEEEEEEEARDILRCALSAEPEPRDNLADGIRRIIEPLGGVDLPSFPRGPLREPPEFS